MKTVEAGKSKSSVLDTSLTELAFIFFFILLLVSVWKLNEQETKLTKLEMINQKQQSIIDGTELVSTLIEKIKEKVGEDSFDEYFTEIAKLNERVKKAEELEQKLHKNETQLAFYEDQISDIFSEKDKEKVLAQIREVALLKELISETLQSEPDPTKALRQILQQRDDVIGQNNNLRQQITKLGNGLVHPPCWANSKTGAIEFIFDVTIHEDGVTFARGWPEARNEQAMADQTIQSIIGYYESNEEHLVKTKRIFVDSVKNNCRHFVRISDQAISKDSFKRQLLAVEKHFYKRLTEVRYGQ